MESADTEMESGEREPDYYEQDQVLKSDRFFLIGRGGFGNFHSGNKKVRQLVLRYSWEYVQTPRKDRAIMGTKLVDEDPSMKGVRFVTQINAVLPRLLKDAEYDRMAQSNKEQQAVPSQKRLISLRRTKSIVERHKSLDNLQTYPGGVYIPVGRNWSLDVVDHLFREVANDIRKDRGVPETGKNSLVVRPGERPDPMPTKIRKAIEAKKITIETTDNALPAKVVALLPEIPRQNPSTQIQRSLQQSSASLDRARALASPDMMEALQGLTALMTSEGSLDPEHISRPQAPLRIDSGSRLVSDQLPLKQPHLIQSADILAECGKDSSGHTIGDRSPTFGMNTNLTTPKRAVLESPNSNSTKKRNIEKLRQSDAISSYDANHVATPLSVKRETNWRFTLPSSSFGSPKQSKNTASGFMLCQNQVIKNILTARFCVVTTNYHCDIPPPPETPLASEVAKKWKDVEPSKRSVCWFDATSEILLCRDFERFTNKVMQQPSQNSPQKQPRMEVGAAANTFYQSIEQLECPAEFFLVFITDVDPYILSRWVNPQHWFSSKGSMAKVKVAIFAQSGNCRWDSQDGFSSMEYVTVHRVPEKRWNDDDPWWSRLPVPNLPPKLPVNINSATFKLLQDHLDMDGSVVAIQPGASVAKALPSLCANQWVRSWMMQNPKERFAIWLSLQDKDLLRKSYLKAICTLAGIENLDGVVLDQKTIAEDLIGLLMMMRSKAPSFQWVVVFADVSESTSTERNEWFFPSSSEWWNGRGRCLITTNELVNLDMDMGEGQDLLDIPVVLLK